MLFAAALCAAGNAFSQTPPDAGRLLDDTLRSPPRIPNNEPATITKPADPPREAPSGSPVKVTVQGFRFVGNTVIPTEELNALMAPEVWRELDLDELNELVDRVKVLYRQRGYFLAIAFLPKQNISDGVITIGILEGRLGKINIKQPFPPDVRVTEQQVISAIRARLKEGDLITERSLEKPLLLIRDLPGVAIRSKINRGDRVGTADLDVEVFADSSTPLINGQVELDNYGNRFAGQYRLGVKSNINGLLGYGDLLSVQGFVTNGGLTDFAGAGYLVPVGPYGTRVGINYGRLNYALGEEFEALNAEGTAKVWDAYVVHPLSRNKDFNLFAQLGFQKKQLDDRQRLAPAQIKDINAYKFQVNGDWRGTGYVNVYTVALTSGKLDIDDPVQRADDQDLTGFKTAGRFTKLTLDYQRLQQLLPKLALLVNGSGQLANKNLTAAEKFSLGGPSRVRGYPAGEASGDQGFIGSGELRYSVPQLSIGRASLVLTTFYDYGHIQRNRKSDQAPQVDLQTANTRNLSSYGVGFYFGAPNQYLLRTSLAWRGSEKPTSDSQDDRPRLWVQGIVWF